MRLLYVNKIYVSHETAEETSETSIRNPELWKSNRWAMG